MLSPATSSLLAPHIRIYIIIIKNIAFFLHNQRLTLLATATAVASCLSISAKTFSLGIAVCRQFLHALRSILAQTYKYINRRSFAVHYKDNDDNLLSALRLLRILLFLYCMRDCTNPVECRDSFFESIALPILPHRSPRVGHSCVVRECCDAASVPWKFNSMETRFASISSALLLRTLHRVCWQFYYEL